jgi:hypothetical protein
MSNDKALGENFYRMMPDETYRRHRPRIVIAQIESLVPKVGWDFDPSIFGGGNGRFTWGRVQRFFAAYPGSRNFQQPMHFYSEYIGLELFDDYVAYVGEALTNRSWFMQAAVGAGLLPPAYADAVLVVIQENYGLEMVEARIWQLLADRVLTPLLRMYGLNWRQYLRFFELEADQEALNSPGWPYRVRTPTYLDVEKLYFYLKSYEKR